MSRPNTPEKFWSHVDQSAGVDGCWPWLCSKTKRGYGKCSWEGVLKGAHQIAYYLAAGRWATGDTCHSCDTAACCNPRHLFDGSHADNQQDMARKGRGRQTLTIEQVHAIKAAVGALSRVLAERYGVSYTQIHRIIRGERRQHV